MNLRLRLLLRAMMFFGMFAIAGTMWAQNFTGTPYKTSSIALDKQFTHYEVYQIDAASLFAFIQSSPDFSQPALVLGDQHWNLQLSPSEIYSPNYTLQVLTPGGKVETSKPSITKAFKGIETQGGGHVRLTVDSDFIYGYVYADGTRYFIEPLWYLDPAASHDLFVVYKEQDVIKDANAGTCALIELQEKAEDWIDEDDHVDSPGAQMLMACYQLEIAIASDNSMFNKYGSIGGVENHNIGVLNDVQGDYTGNFNNDIEFNIVTQFIVTGSDPWSASLNPGTLLDSFRAWGNGGGFGVPFDNGELWTNRNFTGNVIGIAYLNGICTNNKYHCLQDYTTNSNLLRSLTTHELGHNFNSPHDPQGTTFIMSPVNVGSMTWSSNSTSIINAYMTSKINSGCLSPCGPPPPPLVADFEFDPNPACQGQSVQFTDLSSGNVNSRSWIFPSGSPGGSVQANPVVTWNLPGTYNVTLTVTGVGGSASTTKSITVKPQPTASFTYSVDGTSVTFNNTSMNGTDFLWDFGDGEISVEENPFHVYTEAGIYVVMLTVTNECGIATKTLVVNTAPTADFSASPTSGCAAFSVNFTNLSSNNAVAYSWSFPGGLPQTSNLANPLVVYQTPGTYDVSLTVTNISGSSTTVKTGYIHVDGLPVTNFSFTTNGLTATFTNNSSGATSYIWNFGDGSTSTETNPVHTYDDPGVYTVILTSTNDCGSTNITKTVIVSTPPTANFTAAPTSGCGPLTVSFTNQSSGNPLTFNWLFPGGNPSSSTEQNPTVVYNNAGVFNVTLIVGNNAGTDTTVLTNYINVMAQPTAGFTSTVNGLMVTFNNTSQNVVTYNWDFGDNTNSNLANPTHTYANDGSYTVTLTTTNPCGTATFTQTVVIATPPTAGFTASPTVGCGPLTVQFTNASSPNTTSWNWQFPGGTPSSSTQQNPVVVYNNAGTFNVTLTVSNSVGSNTATQSGYITVNPSPVAGFTSSVNGLTATFTNTSQNAVSYNWDFGDDTNSNQANPTHTYDEDGSYVVILTVTNPCGSVTFTQTVVIVTPPTAGFSASPTSGCGPLTVQFTNASSPNATSWNWQFPGGTPSSSTQQNPSVTYNTAGTYTVTLTVSNAAGSNTATQTNYVTVNPAPTAGFSSNVNGAVATFTNNSANATGYVWDFGDNSNSNLANPTHTYANDGTYTVTLTATGPCGTATFTQNVVIITEPTAGFTANTTTGCATLSVQFQDLSSGNTTEWLWTFPGGNPSSSTQQNPLVEYNTPGVYDVTLVATSPGGSSTYTQPGFIVVQSPPTAGFSAQVNGAVVNFTNGSVNATSYSWEFGDGSTSSAANPMHTYLTDGTYTVMLTATNNCGSVTFTQEVTIVLPPTANFTADVTSGCSPLTVQFSNQSSPNATGFSWTFDGGTPTASTDENPVVIWENEGVYSVMLIASNPAGNDTSFMTITVNGLPTAGFSSQTAGLAVVLTNNSVNATSYMWDFGDNETSMEVNPTHTYASTGTYTVTLVATNPCGSVEITSTVEIQGAAPLAEFKAIEDTGCAPFSVSFSDLSAGNPSSWKWSFPGATPDTSDLQNPTVLYNTTGVYPVTLIVTNLYGEDTLTLTDMITVLDLPVTVFNYVEDQGTVTFTNQSSGALSYMWNFGDGSTSDEANPVHTYTEPGTYTVELTAINICGASTLQQTLVITVVSANEPAWLDRFALYPNPNTGAFTVEMSGLPHSEVEFILFDALGQQVKREVAEFGTGTLVRNMDYGHLSPAIYQLHIRAGGYVKVVKVAVQR